MAADCDLVFAFSLISWLSVALKYFQVLSLIRGREDKVLLTAGVSETVRL